MSNNKNKKEKFKWENIYPNNKVDAEITYKKIYRLLEYLQSDIQQLAGAYKMLEEYKKE